MSVFTYVQEQYIERAARKLAPKEAVIDSTARDRDDYRQTLFLRLWQAQKEFQKIPEVQITSASSKKWASAVIRNTYISCIREIRRSPSFASIDFENEHPVETNLETRVHCADLIGRLRECITSGEWELLVNYLENGCNASAAWKAMGKQVSRRGFSKRFQKIQKKARLLVPKVVLEAT